MRFSALQEDGCGIGVTQDRVPTNADESMMATMDNIQPTVENVSEEGSMISNLPLLFANGYPTSLEKITLTQLERFVIFMVQCSLGHDTTEVIREPQWWPKEIKFSNPLIRPKKINESWMANLKKLVFRCYTYHRSDYLLRFCSYLARYPHEELQYVNNWDSTTSLYHKATGKLLVTFRNENMNYDKRVDNHRRFLLSNSVNKVKQQQSLIMVQPPADDIYLCDNCDAEFIGLEKMKEHERICCEQENTNNLGSRPVTPDVSTIEPEKQQNQFLEYFQLSSSKKENKTADNITDQVNNNKIERSSTRVRGSINLTKCRTIPFSSPAGIVLAKKSKAMTEETQQERLERVERHMIAPVLNKTNRPKWLDKEMDSDRWVITHKPNRDKPLDEYVHQYRFYDSLRNKPMISIRSQLLYCACRPVYVVLTRLTQKQIDQMKHDAVKYPCSRRTKTPARKIGPAFALKRQLQMNLSMKRKASSDEDSSLLFDDEEPVKIDKNLNTLEFPTVVKKCSKTESVPKKFSMEKTSESDATNRVSVINLCSSDEEEDLRILTPDENRDPLNVTDSSIKKVNLRRSVPHRLPSKTCIYPTNSTNDCLTDSKCDGSESCVNKRLSDVILNTCTHLSPILRPAP